MLNRIERARPFLSTDRIGDVHLDDRLRGDRGAVGQPPVIPLNPAAESAVSRTTTGSSPKTALATGTAAASPAPGEHAMSAIHSQLGRPSFTFTPTRTAIRSPAEHQQLRQNLAIQGHFPDLIIVSCPKTPLDIQT
ncbi:hypothetical protein [Kitasatospora purpeofusca]|uniref:hypothetical protein n=1 Tax=Kitasatospora purpeofusca TaxID=67352 RepID=UPI0036D366AA